MKSTESRYKRLENCHYYVIAIIDNSRICQKQNKRGSKRFQ